MDFYTQEGKQDAYELVLKHSRIAQRLQQPGCRWADRMR